MRSIWSGAISFGLVNIPIKLYPATGEDKLDFDMLDKKDLSPIRYARVNKRSGQEVSYSQIVKGYEYQKGDYVVLTDEDFQRANARKTKTIDILNFSKEEEIDIVYFEKPYFLEPEKGAEKAYALLREALERSKKVAIAKFVLRNREHLAALKPKEKVLLLDQMRFHSVLRSSQELKLPDEKIADEKEIQMALALIDQLTKPFKAEEYKDTYTQELKEVIEEKAKGKAPSQHGEAPQPTKVPDLIETLRASLEAEKQKGGEATYH